MTQNYKVKHLNCSRKIINFMCWNYLIFIILTSLFIISILIILLKGFNYGLDFTGGILVKINLTQSINVNKIRTSLINNGYQKALVQNFGSSKGIIIRLPLVKKEINQEVIKNIISVINKDINDQAIIKYVSFISPSVSNELFKIGVIVFLLTLICILFYVAFRFRWCLAIGSVISLIYDAVIVLGVISFFRIEVDMISIAALISVIGYSLNDSIVISDRIRENFCKINSSNSFEVINISLTQILNRTLITSSTTLLVVFMFYIFGCSMFKEFFLVMLIGVIIGTISSIYITSALALNVGIKRKHFINFK